MKPKNQRLILVGAALTAVLAAVLLAMWGLRDRAAYFYTPADIAAGKAEPGRPVRLGGMVEKGSVRRTSGTLEINFVVTDFANKVPVRYTGVLPDLFKEGQGVVTHGRLDASGVFVADEVLAKHDENYMPPEVQRSLKKGESREGI